MKFIDKYGAETIVSRSYPMPSLDHWSDEAILGLFGRLLRSGGIKSDRAARLLGRSRSAHYRDMQCAMPEAG